MTLPRLLVVAATVVALAAAAPAADGPTWVASLKQATALARERGAPILVWCVGDVDADEKADQECLRNKDVLKAMAGYLVVFANPVDTHGTQDGTIGGKSAKVCKLAPGIVCSDHMRAWTDVLNVYGEYTQDKAGIAKVPNHFVIGADARVLGTINAGSLAGGFSKVAPAAMITGLRDMLAKAGGPGLSDAQYGDLQKALAAARPMVEGGRMKEAAQALRPFQEIHKAVAIVLEARELLRKVDKEAAPALAQAQALLQGKPLAGLAGLDRVIQEYPGTVSADVAARAVSDFKASPEGVKAMKEMAREKDGRAELLKAIDFAGKDDGRALKALEAVAKKYAGLPSGEEAAEKAAAIRGDPAKMKAIQKAEDERAAKGALTAARGLLDGGKKEEANAKLKEIVDRYPDTDAAKEAARLLGGAR